MRCNCPACGQYMNHREHAPGCVCPNCLRACKTCLGSDQQLPAVDAAELSQRWAARMRSDTEAVKEDKRFYE